MNDIDSYKQKYGGLKKYLANQIQFILILFFE